MMFVAMADCEGGGSDDEGGGGDDRIEITPPGARQSARYDNRSTGTAGSSAQPRQNEVNAPAPKPRSFVGPPEDEAPTPPETAKAEASPVAFGVQSGPVLPVRVKINTENEVSIDVSIIEAAEIARSVPKGVGELAKNFSKIGRPKLGPDISMGYDKDGLYVTAGVKAGVGLAEAGAVVKVYPNDLSKTRPELEASYFGVTSPPLKGPSVGDAIDVANDWYGEATRRVLPGTFSGGN